MKNRLIILLAAFVWTSLAAAKGPESRIEEKLDVLLMADLTWSGPDTKVHAPPSKAPAMYAGNAEFRIGFPARCRRPPHEPRRNS